MSDTKAPPNSVPVFVPDADIPTEKVETNSSLRRKANRARRFLKGPIPLLWIRKHILKPADRLLLVLRAHSDMRQSIELKVSSDILGDAGITNRKTAYRAIAQLEDNGSLSVSRKRGRRPIVRLIQPMG